MKTHRKPNEQLFSPIGGHSSYLNVTKNMKAKSTKNLTPRHFFFFFFFFFFKVFKFIPPSIAREGSGVPSTRSQFMQYKKKKSLPHLAKWHFFVRVDVR